MSQLGDSYMLNSDLSPPHIKPLRRSRKHQQIGAEPNPLLRRVLPVYQQAVQKASDLLGMPVALLSLFGDEEKIAAAVGLDFLGESASIPALGIQGCSQYLERSHQCLAIADLSKQEQFCNLDLPDATLREQLQVAAYIGVSLWMRSGECIGTLALMDKQVREFSERDRSILQLVADWLMAELERDILFKAQVASFFELPGANALPEKPVSLEAEAKFNLLSHLSQSLRTPLTAVMGMTSVLQRELYGPLNEKQHSYMGVVHQSGQHLVSLIDEIANLGGLEQIDSRLTLKAADIEMLCQQSIRDLEPALKQRGQRIEVAIEMTNRVWLLDRDKVRQILFYLLLHTMYAVPAESSIGMSLSIEGNSQVETLCDSSACTFGGRLVVEIAPLPARNTANLRVLPSHDKLIPVNVDVTHTQLGLVLCHVLAEAHDGALERMGNHGHRLLLPLITSDLEEIINNDC
jgi:signal transduction histidine kinase